MGATLRSDDLFCTSHVSIHAPIRSTTAAVRRLRNADVVSIHTPVRGRTLTDNLRDQTLEIFQPTCSHEAQPVGHKVLARFCAVSIRAQTEHDRVSLLFCSRTDILIHMALRVRRCHHHGLHLRYEVSTHAPLRGATACGTLRYSPWLFQSTRRTGRD
jgi:hypothetical protein